MWFLRAPAAVVGLVAVALLPTVASKPLSVPVEELSELHNGTQLEKRQCAGTVCGFYGQACCTSGETCTTNANDEAVCVAAAGATATGGSWTYSTVYYTQTGVVTQTSIWSSLIAAEPTAQACAASQKCDSTCCESGFYCSAPGTCKPIGGSTPGVTATGSPTTTLPFSTPIPTGANGTLVESNAGGGGLSGGAIAGIVIGVIFGVILLLLLCFYCCAKSAFSAILAIFGLGKKRRTHEETTYIEGHHHSGSAAAGGRRWYGQGGSSRPRPPKKSSGGIGKMLGVGAGLAGLAAVLGMKRKHDRRHDDKSTTVSGSSYYYSDYTSASSASSDDRRTRHTRHSSRRG